MWCWEKIIWILILIFEEYFVEFMYYEIDFRKVLRILLFRIYYGLGFYWFCDFFCI